LFVWLRVRVQKNVIFNRLDLSLVEFEVEYEFIVDGMKRLCKSSKPVSKGKNTKFDHKIRPIVPTITSLTIEELP
jgi:hypothetical protein